MRSLGRDILTGTIAGLVSGLIIALVATQILEPRLNEQQNRLENLRYVRDISTRNSGPMPFRNLDLKGMNLSGLHLPCRDKVRVEGCGLKADFTGAKLSSSNMSVMDLEGADFTGADLTNADLSESRLAGADFHLANMTDVKLNDVCYDPNSTAWPRDFTPPADPDGNGELCSGGL